MSQDPQVARRRVEIVNALGLHLRPAARFIDLAKRFEAQILIRFKDEEIDGKSMLGLTTLAAERGSFLEMEARGPDAEAAVTALAALVAARFYEDDEGGSVELPS